MGAQGFHSSLEPISLGSSAPLEAQYGNIDIVGNVDIIGNVDIVDNVDIVGNVDMVGNVDIVDC